MQQINIDDSTGEKWAELLESIQKRLDDNKRGNIEPIVITSEKAIDSGHRGDTSCQTM